jgi:hypothetical protein
VDLTEAQRCVLESTGDDWERFPEPELAEDGHESRATYRPDVQLELSWGRTGTDDVREPWMEEFPDSSGHSFQVEATYSGATVLRELFVAADGGLCLVPQPRVTRSAAGEPVYSVTFRQMALARLLHGLEGSGGHGPDIGVATAHFEVTD